MTYEVLARKWRPQQFDDVVGQDHVAQTLKNAIKTDRIAHAYLFVGPRGIGKTSVARIFAKALNCSGGPTVTPCDKCDSCREIMTATSLDVLEIDGASNNGVEQVRELRETVKFLPAHGLFKIYIIDEVHMLSVPAFNALLKTLEEPPSHVKFIFATTEPQKILPTIVSRCQRFDLRRITVQAIIERLRLIVKSEKIKVDDDALLAIARGAEGGLRDAESALDQLISFKGNEITEDDVLSIFGLVARDTLENLGKKILEGDIRGMLKIVADLDKAGKDLQRLVLEMMEHFRNLLVYLQVGDDTEGLDLTDTQITGLKKQAELTDTARVLRLMRILSETEDRMKYALSRRTILETALIRCSRSAVVVSLEEILAGIRNLYTGQDDPSGPSGTGVRRTIPSSGGRGPRKEHGQSEEMPSEGGVADTDELMMLRERWHEIIEKVGKIAVLARRYLLDTAPVLVEGDRVVIGLDPEFAEEAKSLELTRNRKAIEHVLETVLKRAVKVEFRSRRPGGAGGEAQAAGREKSGGKSPSGEDKGGGNGKKMKSTADWAEDPAVRKVMDMFDGEILDVRE